MNHFSSAFYYLKGGLILNGQIEKILDKSFTFHGPTHKISPFLFPREVQMILKIAFVEIMDLFTYFAE